MKQIVQNISFCMFIVIFISLYERNYLKAQKVEYVEQLVSFFWNR